MGRGKVGGAGQRGCWATDSMSTEPDGNFTRKMFVATDSRANVKDMSTEATRSFNVLPQLYL